MTRLLRGLADRLNPHRDSSASAPASESETAPASADPAAPAAPAPAAHAAPAHASASVPVSGDASPSAPPLQNHTPSLVPAPNLSSSSGSSHLAPPTSPEGGSKSETRSSSFASSRRTPSPDMRRDVSLSSLVGHVGDHLSRTFGSGGNGNDGHGSIRRRHHRSRPSTAPAGPNPAEGEQKATRARPPSRPQASAAEGQEGSARMGPGSAQDRTSASAEDEAVPPASGQRNQTRLRSWPEEENPARVAGAVPAQQASVLLTSSAPVQGQAPAPAPPTAEQPNGSDPPAPPPGDQLDQPAQPPDAANGNNAVATFRSGSLKEYDLFTLGPNEWLSDNVLAFWFELIEAQIQDRGSPSASLWPPSVVELMSALPEDTPPEQARALFPPLKPVVILPVNDGYSSESAQAPEAEGGSHWSLIVVTEADAGKKAKARHYDSMVPTNRESAARVWERWCACFCPDAKTAALEEAEELEPQENESDCGLYVLALAGLLLLDRSPHPVAAKMAVRKVRAHEVERYRARITSWLARWRQFSTEQQAEWKLWDDVVQHVGPMPLLPI